MKKAGSVVLCAILVSLLSVPTPVYAWRPDEFFGVSVDEANIPTDTAYIDLLLPISPEDEAYVPYHEANGEAYGISRDSEIVGYCADGYRSYTFHIADAVSDWRPHYTIFFSIPRELHEEYADTLEELCMKTHRISDRMECEVDVAFGSDTKEKLQQIEAQWNLDIREESRGYYYTYYGIPDAEYDFEYLRTAYKSAKMAYVDANGRVLGVSNEVPVNDRFPGGVHLALDLSGDRLTATVSGGPPVYLIGLVGVAFLVGVLSVGVSICLGICLLVVLIVRRFRKKKA